MGPRIESLKTTSSSLQGRICDEYRRNEWRAANASSVARTVSDLVGLGGCEFSIVWNGSAAPVASSECYAAGGTAPSGRESGQRARACLVHIAARSWRVSEQEDSNLGPEM